MIVVSDEMYRALFAFGGIKAFGLVKVNATRGVVHPQGIASVAPDAAEIQEWAIGAEVVARKVRACGRQMCWLRRDLADYAEAALVREHDEMELMRADVISMVERDRQRVSVARSNVTPFVPSREMVRALFRHQSRVGRLHDRTAKGDELRARFAMLLDRADMAHDGENV